MFIPFHLFENTKLEKYIFEKKIDNRVMVATIIADNCVDCAISTNIFQ